MVRRTEVESLDMSIPCVTISRRSLVVVVLVEWVALEEWAVNGLDGGE